MPTVVDEKALVISLLSTEKTIRLVFEVQFNNDFESSYSGSTRQSPATLTALLLDTLSSRSNNTWRDDIQ